MKQIVLAGLVTLASISVVGPAVEAAPGDYLPRAVLTFQGDQGDIGDPSADLVSGTVTVDPNAGDALLDIRLGFVVADGRIVVIYLGRLSGEDCVSDVEILVATSGSLGPIVRAAGSNALPQVPPGPSSPIQFWPVADSLLHGLEVECGWTESRTAEDALLDEAEMTITPDPVEAVGLGGLELGGIDVDTDPVVQGEPGQSIDLRLKLKLTGDTRAYDVSVAFTPSAGVTVTPDVVEADLLGELTAIDASVHRLKADLQLTIPDPGLHSLTISLTIGNGDPVEWNLDLWGRGGTLPDATDSLAGRGYLGERSFNPGTHQLGWRLWQGVWFVDGEWAWRARRHTLEAWTPRYGVPAACGPSVPGCVDYDYDATTHELVLDGWYGELGDTEGWWGWEPVTKFEPDGRRSAVYQQRLAKLDDGPILFTGRNFFFKDVRGFGRTRFTIELDKDGTFRRTFRQELFENTKTTTTTGTYTLGRRGRLTLSSSSGVKRTTLLDVVGAPGLWIDGVWFRPT